jgi:hypothetical protein
MHKLDRPDEASALAESALATDGLGPEELRPALDSLIDAKWYRGQFREALQLVARARALAQTLNDRVGILQALNRAGAMLTQLGEWTTAEAHLREAAALAARLGMVAYQRNTLFNLCVLHSEQSHPAALLATARECWDLTPPMPLDMQRALMRAAFIEAHVALGDLGAAFTWALGGIDDALALGRGFGAAALGSTSGELLTVLGESQRLTPLLALLDSPAAKSVKVARETWFVLVGCALMDGRLDAARAARQHVDDDEPNESPRIGLHMSLVDAALAQAAGDAAGALAQLPADDAPGLNDELRWRVLAVRLRAEAASGGCSASTLAAADAALARQGVHALAALQRHRALLQVAETAARRQAWRQRVEALSQTLHDLPELRLRFEQRWFAAG